MPAALRYAAKGFAGFGEYRGSIAAFLFTWRDGDTSKPAVKLQKVSGGHTRIALAPAPALSIRLIAYAWPSLPGGRRGSRDDR